MVRPLYSVSPKAAHDSQSMRDTPLKPASSITQMKPMMSAAAAGLGSPWKKRLSTTAMLVLKRARRSAAPEQ